MTTDPSTMLCDYAALPTRPRVQLMRNGYRTVGDVARTPDAELMFGPKIGPVRLAQIREVIAYDPSTPVPELAEVQSAKCKVRKRAGPTLALV